MAELVLERWTTCPTGNPQDERSLEVVLQDDDPRSAKDPTPRVTRAVRLFLRGDPSLLRHQTRDVLLTVGDGDAREIACALRYSARQSAAVLVSEPVAMHWPLMRGGAGQTWHVWRGPARGPRPPQAHDPMAAYLRQVEVAP